jgi:hypothetical protein
VFAIGSTREAGSTVAAVMAGVTAALISGLAVAQDKVSVGEYITLPKFCWYLFSGGAVSGASGASGAEYQMSNCGPRVNHYCYGLLDLQRSKKAKNINDRRILLTRARQNTLYTLEGLKLEGTMATCSIAPHVQATMRAIELDMKVYNVK